MINQLKRNEQGFSLLLTILISLLVSIIIISTLFITSNTYKLNHSKKNSIQAIHLAEIGVTELANEITNSVNDRLKNGVGLTAFTKYLKEDIEKKYCHRFSKYEKEIKTGKYSACVVKTKGFEYTNGNSSYNETMQIVTIKSNSETKDGKTYFLESDVLIGAEPFPEALKYALSTHNSRNNNNYRDGSIFLLGSPSIQGDIKSANNLILDHWSDAGSSFYDAGRYANFMPTNNAPNNLVINNNIYKTKEKPKIYTESSASRDTRSKSSSQLYRSLLEPINATNKNIEKLTQLDNLLIVQRDAPISDVDIRNTILNNVSQQDASTILNRVSRNSNTLEIVKNIQFDKLYSKYNIIIGNDNVSYQTPERNYSNIEITGVTKNNEHKAAQLFVEGSVTIKGVNLKSNLIIYAKGDVNLQFGTLSPANLGNKQDGILIIFTEGKINISNFSQYKNDPSQLEGFFYSKDEFNIKGNLSNYDIHGGIAAKTIYLNGQTGTYKRTTTGTPSGFGNYRLTLRYNENLISNFLKMYPPEPVFYQLKEPQTLNSKKKNHF